MADTEVNISDLAVSTVETIVEKEQVADKTEELKEHVADKTEELKENLEKIKNLTEKADEVAKIAKVIGMDKKVEEVAEATKVAAEVVEKNLDKIVGVVEEVNLSGCLGIFHRLMKRIKV